MYEALQEGEAIQVSGVFDKLLPQHNDEGDYCLAVAVRARTICLPERNPPLRQVVRDEQYDDLNIRGPFAHVQEMEEYWVANTAAQIVDNQQKEMDDEDCFTPDSLQNSAENISNPSGREASIIEGETELYGSINSRERSGDPYSLKLKYNDTWKLMLAGYLGEMDSKSAEVESTAVGYSYGWPEWLEEEQPTGGARDEPTDSNPCTIN